MSLSLQTNESQIEQLLQTGFETIVQAFELKNTQTQNIINNQSSKIRELEQQITLFKEEIEILKQEQDFYKKENSHLRETNKKLNTSLKSSQTKLKLIHQPFNEDNTTNNPQIYYKLKPTPLFTEEPIDKHFNTDRGTSTDNIRLNTINVINKEIGKYDYMNYHNKNPLGHNTSSHNSSANVRSHNKNRHESSYTMSSNVGNKYGHIETKVTNLKQNFNSKRNTVSSCNKYSYIPHKEGSNQQHNNKHQRNPRMNTDINNNVHTKNSSFFKSFNNLDIMNKFLKECKEKLSPYSFDTIVALFQDYKDNLLNDNDLISKTRNVLAEYEHLLKLFEDLFLCE